MTTTIAAPPQTHTATARTATVSAVEFMRAATNAILSAGTDDTLPSLCAVHFRPGHLPGTLMLEATNRHVASQEHIDLADLAAYDSDWPPSDVANHMEADHGWERAQLGPHGGVSVPADIEKQHRDKHAKGQKPGHTHSVRPVPVTELDVLVNAGDLAKLVKTLKLVIEPGTKLATGHERPHVVISHAEGDEKVAFTLINNLGTETTVSPRAVEGDYPRLDSLMASAELPAEELDAKLRKAADANGRTPDDVWERRYLFNPKYLTIYTKIDTGERRGYPVEFAFTASGKPALVKIGERYRALIVPIRGA